MMENKARREDTVSDMSVQDILDELKNESFDSEDGLLLDEILAEFSGGPKAEKREELPKKEKQVVSEVLKEEAPKKEKEAPKIKKEEPKKADAEHTTVFSAEEVKKAIEKKDNEETKVIAPKEEAASLDKTRVITDIVRPWEDGVYGDMKLSGEKEKAKEKKHKLSKLAETFDTFTRSELFESKKETTVSESRTAAEIIKDNKQIIRFLGIRSMFLLLISALLCYVSFAAPLQWYMPRCIAYIEHPFRFLFIMAFLQICAMLLSIDILSKGLAKLFRLRPTVESAIAFSSFASLIHVISIMAMPSWKGWLPYSAISALTLLFAVYAKLVRTRAITRVCKTVESSKTPGAVHVENMYGEMNTIKKQTDDVSSFVAHLNDKDSSEVFWTFLSPIVIVASIVFAAISSFGTGAPEHFFWALAAISSVSTPFFAMLSFAHPFATVTKGLSSIGAAISGWYSASKMTKKNAIIISDRDIYPKGTVTLHGLKILGSYSLEQTLSYASSIIKETGCGLTDVFMDLLKSRYGVPVKVSNLRYHESGGLETEIGSDKVLLGTGGFLLRNGIRLNSGTNVKNALYIAINGEPAGVFNIHYKENEDVERALHMLVKKKIPVTLAVRDFNLLPMAVEKAFNIKDGILEYPEIEQRINLSATEQFTASDISAVITRAGLYPFAASSLASIKLRRVTLRNLFLTTFASIIGMLFMFYLTFMQRPVLITPHTVFVYMMLWLIPTYLLSKRVKV